jgi:Tfp pilus assembly protein PilV
MSSDRFAMKVNGYQNGATSPSQNAIMFQQQQRMQQSKMLKGGACNLAPSTVPQFSSNGPQITASSGGINNSISRMAATNDQLTMNKSNSSCIGSPAGSCTGSCGGGKKRRTRFRLKRKKSKKTRNHRR